MNQRFNTSLINLQKQPSRGIADKFIGNEFEQLNVMKLPLSDEVHGRTSLTTLERSDDSPMGKLLQKAHKSGGVSFRLRSIQAFPLRSIQAFDKAQHASFSTLFFFLDSSSMVVA